MASSADKQSDISLLQDVPPVQKRVQLFHQVLNSVPDAREDQNIPNVLFEDWSEDHVVQDENFSRDIIRSFRDTNGKPWEELLSSCTQNQKDMLEDFTNGKVLDDVYDKFDFDSTRGTRQEFQELKDATTVRLGRDVTLGQEVSLEQEVPGEGQHEHLENEARDAIPTAFHLKSQRATEIMIFDDPEGNKKIFAKDNATFSNWGCTVENKPRYTCVPTTRYGIQQIVKYAEKNGLGVRVSGYRHSWSPSFARAENAILISTIDLERATETVNKESLQPIWPWSSSDLTGDLNAITLLNLANKPGEKSLVRVGCATTNEQLRSWCIETGHVTLPLNVIMVEITFGGSNAPICHGAGRKHQTLSDLVYKIEYVDAHGQYRTIDRNDGDFLSAASGCFGLIGVITHLTLEFDPMIYAEMRPRKVDVIDAIPPPPHMRADIPKALYKPRTNEQIQKAQEDFETRASDHYYAEWFWFPYADQVWINTWQTTTDSSHVENYPSKKKIVQQWLEAVAMEAMQNLASNKWTKYITPSLRTTTVSRMAMSSLPDDNLIKTYLPDALHFRRAIQNTRVRDIEVEIPLPPRSDNPEKPDYAVVQEAWWRAIKKAYEPNYAKTEPMRMPLEMRIMGDSNVVMAPQRGNKLGTCAIEVLTLQSCKDIWPAFAQDVLKEWMDLRHFGGHELNIRPHWAKEWHDFQVDNKPFLDHLKNVSYKDEIVQFNGILEKIGKKHDWTRADIKARFSNELFDKLFFDDL